MGIKKLNSYLLSNCSTEAISRCPLSHFKGKTLAIDASIYMYKYLSENAFLENFYNLLSIFRQYQITPLFVFDGKPPIEKNTVLCERYQKRKDAETKYNVLLQQIEDQSKVQAQAQAQDQAQDQVQVQTEEERQQEMEKLASLKRQCIRVTETELLHLKQLLSNFGLSYIEASGEADVMCAYLVKTKQAYACISDDMDMFVYDCPIVIRKLSLTHHNCMVYYVNYIKQELDLSQLSPVLMLCGTDYTPTICWDICTAIQRYQFFEDETERGQTSSDFYTWIYERRFVDEVQLQQIQHSVELFAIPPSLNVVLSIKSKDWSVLQSLLEEKGFMFVE